MSKKYQITNLNQNDECTIFYLLYIVLFFVIIFIIYKIIFIYNKTETFDNLVATKTLSPEELMQELQSKNMELTNMKNTLQDKLQEQSLAIYLSQNYDKVDSSSFDDELSFLLVDFANTQLPSIDTEGKQIVQTQAELSGVLSEASGMKNFYKPGDIVSSNSTFNIGKNDICYRSNGKPIKPDPTFISQYPNCMVCSVESEDTLDNSNAWLNTKTNINKVCLFNPKAESNSGIPDLKQCQQFCNINK